MKKAKKAQEQVNFRFVNIAILSNSIAVPKDLKEPIDIFTFNLSTEFHLNPNEKMVIVRVAVEILSKDQDLSLGNLTTENRFQIENYDEIVFNDEDERDNLPESFLVILNSISISTTRGVMWQMYKGTFLHNALLPIVDPQIISV